LTKANKSIFETERRNLLSDVKSNSFASVWFFFNRSLGSSCFTYLLLLCCWFQIFFIDCLLLF